MTDEQWQVQEGTGWISIPGFGSINPRRDNHNGGRQYFDAKLQNGEYAHAGGNGITGGPETWYFEFDQPFLLTDSSESSCVEVEISLLKGGIYAVRHRPGQWPERESGAW